MIDSWIDDRIGDRPVGLTPAWSYVRAGCTTPAGGFFR
jgi:hypothetical protein